MPNLDKLSQAYNQKRFLPEYFWKDFLPDVQNCIGSTYLELGCGSGRIMQRIAQDHPSTLCIGLDISTSMLLGGEKQLREAQVRNTELIQFDFNNTSFPFKTKSISCVSIFQSIHFFQNDDIYREIDRVIKENGYIFVGSTTHSQFRDLPYCRFKPIIDFELERTLDTSTIIKLFAKYKFNEFLSRDYYIYKTFSHLNELINFLKVLPYSAFCDLDDASLEEAIAQATSEFAHDSNTRISFLVDAFRVSLFKRQ